MLKTYFQFHVLTTFPEYFEPLKTKGVIAQAISGGLIKMNIVQVRDFATDRHRSTDDRPFGGGDGMVMTYEPLKKALESLVQPGFVVAMSAQGRVWCQDLAKQYALGQFEGCLRPNAKAFGANSFASEFNQTITLICGRYGGIDERFLQLHVHDEICVGDYILSGGEIAAMTVIDSVGRLLPGVLGHPESALKDSFTSHLLEGPLWSRPEKIAAQTDSGLSEYQLEVPAILTQGHHKKIEEHRQMLSWIRTLERRPDLFKKATQSLHGGSEQIFLQMRKWVDGQSDEELQKCGVDSPQKLREILVSYDS